MKGLAGSFEGSAMSGQDPIGQGAADGGLKNVSNKKGVTFFMCWIRDVFLPTALLGAGSKTHRKPRF